MKIATIWYMIGIVCGILVLLFYHLWTIESAVIVLPQYLITQKHDTTTIFDTVNISSITSDVTLDNTSDGWLPVDIESNNLISGAQKYGAIIRHNCNSTLFGRQIFRIMLNSDLTLGCYDEFPDIFPGWSYRQWWIEDVVIPKYLKYKYTNENVKKFLIEALLLYQANEIWGCFTHNIRLKVAEHTYNSINYTNKMYIGTDWPNKYYYVMAKTMEKFIK